MIFRWANFIAVFLGVTTQAQNLMPNPGFEQGPESPAGWKISGGAGKWETSGHQGQRCLSVTGDGKNSFAWRSESISLKASALYRLRFWGRRAPDASGGCVVAGSGRINRDFRFTETWQPYSYIFSVPEDGANDFIRLGQWEQKGAVYFDDVELVPVVPIFTRAAGGLELGEGERFEKNIYRCRLSYGGPGANYHRVLATNRCAFNSDRWTFTTGSLVTYRHKQAGVGLRSAKLRINVNYYVAGGLNIEVSNNGNSWQTATTFDGNRRGGEVVLPAALFPTEDLYVRLTGTGQPCNLQVNAYELEAVLAKPVPDAQGKTSFLEIKQNTGELAVSLPEIADSSLGVRVKNISATSLALQAVVQLESQAGQTTKLRPLAPSDAVTTNLLVKLDRPGAHAVQVKLSDAKGRTLFVGETILNLGFLQDPRPGYWLAEKPTLGVWWCESGWKIGRHRGPPEKPRDGKIKPVAISAARGEFEAAQVVLQPRQDMDLKEVRVKPFRDGSGREGAITLSLHEVAYVNVTHPTDNTCETGWYPDPLPPLHTPLKLAKNLAQPLWLTFYVTNSVAAGDYRGELELHTAAGLIAVPLAVHVYDFELSRDTHLKSALGLSPSEINRYHHLTAPAQRQEVYEKYLQNFAAHRIAPYSFFAYAPMDIRFEGDKPNRQARVDFTRFDQAAAKWLDEYRFSTFRLPLRGMGGGTFHSRHLGELEGFKEGTPEHARLFKDYLGQIEAHLRQRGWLEKAYTYWFDEPDPKDYEFVADGMKRIKAAAPGLRRMLTEQPEAGLLGQVDIWCALTPEWTPEKVQARHKAAEEVWWYICCGPLAPYLTEFIDHPGTELRLWPWQSWQYGVQGILIWETTYWTSTSAFPPPKIQDPWEDPMSYVSGYDYKPGQIGYWGNGDGRFIYPPRGALTSNAPCLEAPVSSFRWENLRDGMEDYEYFWLLQQAITLQPAARQATPLLKDARALLTVPMEISQDTRNFTTDPRLLLAHRDRLARMIERLKRR